MNKGTILLFVFSIIAFSFKTFGSDNYKPDQDSCFTKITESEIEPFPILSYDTDAGLGYGAKCFLLNQFDISESIDLTLFNSTKGERWYRFVFSLPDFEHRQGKIFPLSYDLYADYDKWIKNGFYGTGSSAKVEEKEFYTKETVELSLTFSSGLVKQFVFQGGVKYKSVKAFNFENENLLISRLLFQTAKLHSVFFIAQYDTRNSFINASKGIVLKSEAEFAIKSAVVNTSFTRFSLLFHGYTVILYPKAVLAVRTGINTLIGDNIPIQVYLPLGGTHTLRGFPQDRFLDRTTALINTELRLPVYGRFGAVAGFDAGKTFSSIGKFSFDCWVGNYVAGLRFNMDNYIIRFDAGFSSETTGIYFNFGHLF